MVKKGMKKSDRKNTTDLDHLKGVMNRILQKLNKYLVVVTIFYPKNYKFLLVFKKRHR